MFLLGTKHFTPFHISSPISPTCTTWWGKFMCLLAGSHCLFTQTPAVIISVHQPSGIATFKTGSAQNKKWHGILCVRRRCTGIRALKRSRTGFLEHSSQWSRLSCDQRQWLSLLLEGFCCPLCTVTQFPQDNDECSQHSLAVVCD